MIYILHSADFHLDAPFAALPPERAAARRGEQRALLDKLADTARERGADLVLLAGDLWDSAQTYYETAQALAAALRRMEIPVFIAPGNHDYYDSRSLYATMSWPENVYIFTSEEMTAVPIPSLNCVVHGSAFTGTMRQNPPLQGFSVPDDGMLHLMVLHGDIGGRVKSRGANIGTEEIARTGLTYLALGHIHAPSGLQKAGGTYWAYPGCPLGRGFDETGERGALFLSAEPGQVTAEFLPMGARRYELLELDVTGADPAQALLDAIPPGAEEHCYRIRLTGEAEEPDLPALARLVEHRFYSVDVRDHTRPPRALWAREGEDSLTGAFLRQLRAREAAGEDARCITLAAQFGLAALENREDFRP